MTSLAVRLKVRFVFYSFDDKTYTVFAILSVVSLFFRCKYIRAPNLTTKVHEGTSRLYKVKISSALKMAAYKSISKTVKSKLRDTQDI